MRFNRSTGGSSAVWGKFYKGIAVPEEQAATGKRGYSPE